MSRLCPIVIFLILDASKKTGKSLKDISQGFYNLFHLFIELNMPFKKKPINKQKLIVNDTPVRGLKCLKSMHH